MTTISRSNLSELRHLLASDLVEYFVGNQDKPLLFLYSGGSCLNCIPHFASQLQNRFYGKDVWFAPVDERFDVTVSNYRLLKSMECFDVFSRMGFRFVDVLEHGDSLENAAYWYNGWLRSELHRIKLNDGKIVSILGMGEDGHTAGIFPYPENEMFFSGEFVNTNRLVTGYDVGDKNVYRDRITLTYPALNMIDSVWGYVSGDNKKEALERVISNDVHYALTPAVIWNDLKDFRLYTDLLL